MTEERFEEVLRETARGYNDPPPTPRDEIWARIQSARQQSRKPIPPGQPRPLHRVPWWLGIAAALLLGIGIGRAFIGPSAELATDVRGDRLEQVASADPVGEGEAERASEPRSTAEPPVSAVTARAAETATPRTGRTVSPAGARGEATRSSPPPPADVAGLYRSVAYETLGQAEALLTVFRIEERPEERARVSAWARNVLTSTRLLLDSPAAEDPQLAGLLQDLELVLAQIAALGEGRDAERELIDDTIRQRDVLPRLRTVTPTGASSAGA